MERNVDDFDRNLFELSKSLSIQVMAHSIILYALLARIEQQDLQRVKEFLETLAATSDFQEGSLVDASRVAIEMVSYLTGNNPVDPRKLFHLIPGGKKV
ncbi:MAG: hypothetical protein Q8K00_08360 [Syntrophales bacterium]|nr:hypothetical protein [Syntrophales bacterium]